MKKTNFNPNKLLFKAKKYKISKFFKNEWLHFLAVCSNFFKEKGFLKYFAFVYFVYFIGYFGLLRANVYYIDDLGRSKDGYFGFLNFSRYLSENLSKLIHLNLYTNTDISPITQLIAIAILSFGSMLLVKIIVKKQNYFALFASIPLGLSPFFLENMSYKFDSPFMALALISPIIPFLFLRKKFCFFIVSILAILTALNTYQAANSVYIVLSMFFIFLMFINKNTLRYICINLSVFIFSYIIALGIYKFYIATNVNTYVSSEIIKENFIKGVFENIKKTLDIYNNAVNHTAFKYILCIVIFIFLIASFKKSKINKINTLILGIIFIITSICFTQGAYLVLKTPLFATRAFNSIGVLVSIIFIYSLNFNKFNISKIIICFGIYFLIIQANSYANALKAQDDYSKIRMELMYSDINKIIPDDNVKFNIFITKGIDDSPVVKNSIKNFPIINSLVFQRLGPYWYWSGSANFQNFGFKGKYVLTKCYKDENKIIKVLDTHMHKITQYDNNCFTIEFK